MREIPGEGGVTMAKLLGAGITKFQKLREMVDKAVEHAWEQGEPGKS